MQHQAGDNMRQDDPLARGARIVVLGAGYGGLTCFLELQDHLPRGCDLVLVSSDRYHWFTTELHSYAAGSDEDSVRIPLKRLVRPPGRLVQDYVTALHPAERQVELKVSGRLDYDLLVVALGSQPEYFGLPGVAENALTVGNAWSAARVRERVKELVGERRETPQVVVAGGGLTGVELAGELADEYPGQLRVTILEAAKEIMAGFDPELVQVARGVLEDKGIRILTGNPIVAVDESVIRLRKGDEVAYDLLVWAGGVRGPAVLAGTGLELSPRGRARVDPFLRSVSDDRIYVVGDAASFTDVETGREVPPTGQAAVQMGRLAGGNILRRLRGGKEQPFTFRKRGQFASLGKHEGVGQLGRESMAGLPAMVVKHLIEGVHAWEMGSGVMPLLRKLVEAPVEYLAGYRRYRVRPDLRTALRERQR